MTWWEIARLFLAVVAGGCMGGLMGGWAAERRLDRVWDERTRRPRLSGGYEAPSKPFRLPKVTGDCRLNDQARADAEDRGPANPGGGG